MKTFKKYVFGKDHAGAVGFVISLLILGMIVAALVGTFAYNLQTASTDEAIAGGNLSNSSAGAGTGAGVDNFTYGGIPGGPAMLLLIALLFIVIPVVIFAKAAS